MFKSTPITPQFNHNDYVIYFEVIVHQYEDFHRPELNCILSMRVKELEIVYYPKNDPSN